MGITLVDPSKEYELIHPSGASFRMRHWTNALQEIVEKECFVPDGASFKWNLTKEREIKVDQCVISWSGIQDEAGKELECNKENKALLPVGVRIWIVKDIDERAGLRMPVEEKKN